MSGRLLGPLLEGLRASQHQYLSACDWADPSTAAALRDIAARRAWFAATLELAFRDEDARHVSRAAASRIDAHFRLAARLPADKADILRSFEESEADLLSRYRRLIACELPADLALLLVEQYSEIRGTHAEIRAARHEDEWARSA